MPFYWNIITFGIRVTECTEHLFCWLVLKLIVWFVTSKLKVTHLPSPPPPPHIPSITASGIVSSYLLLMTISLHRDICTTWYFSLHHNLSYYSDIRLFELGYTRWINVWGTIILSPHFCISTLCYKILATSTSIASCKDICLNPPDWHQFYFLSVSVYRWMLSFTFYMTSSHH